MKKITIIFLISLLSVVNSQKVPSSLTDNLLVYLPFNGNANDESGNANTTYVHEAALTTDYFGTPGSAYLFDGSNDYITIVDNGSLDPTTNFTVCAWINTTGTGYYTGIVNNVWDNNADESGYGLVYDSLDRMYTIARTDATYAFWDSGCSAPVIQNVWEYYVGTYNGTEARIYKNGSLVNTVTATGNVLNTFPNDMWVGRYYDSNEQYYFSGKIDEVRIYNRTLSDVEVSELYNLNLNTVYSPANISIVHESSDPELSWDAVITADSYSVYSSADPYADFPAEWTASASGITETTWTDSTAAGTKRFYKVTAVNSVK